MILSPTSPGEENAPSVPLKSEAVPGSCVTCGADLPPKTDLCLACMMEEALADPDEGRADSRQFARMRKIGEGAFAEVFEARQIRPIVRNVAVKVIKAGLVSRQVAARFEAEGRMMARLSHPAIASVYDAGIQEDGRPFLVTELVENAAPITSWAKESGASLRDRAVVLLGLARGIHHAHVKGILHRDLKPANLLVSTTDETPQGKIIDFGVAKLLDPSEDGPTGVHTHQLQILGTPAYMSPEQAECDPFAVDARSDVYALGAVGYEIFTGQSPRPTAENTSLATMLRRVREEDPPSPRSVCPTLPRDLDAVLRKAMNRDPALRYASADAMGDDLCAFLEARPVSARSSSLGYVLWKFVRRHIPLCVASALAVLSMVAGLVISRHLYVESEKARRQADAGERLARRALADAGMLLAGELVRQGRHAEAAARLSDLLRREPSHPEAATYLGGLMASAPIARRFQASAADAAAMERASPMLEIGVETRPLPPRAVSKDGRLALEVGPGPNLRLRDTSTGEERRFPAGSDGIRSLAISSNGEEIAYGNDRGSVHVVNVVSGLPAGELRLPAPAEALCFGDNLVVGCLNGSVHVWGPQKSGPPIHRLRLPSEHSLTHVLEVEEGLWLLRNRPGGVWLWRAELPYPTEILAAGLATSFRVDLAGQKATARIRPDGEVIILEFPKDLQKNLTRSSGDPTGILTRRAPHHFGGIDTGTAVVTPVPPGTLLRVERAGTRMEFHTETPVVAAALDESEMRLAAVCADRRLYLWNLQTGRPLLPPFLFPHRVVELSFLGPAELLGRHPNGKETVWELPDLPVSPDAVEERIGLRISEQGVLVPLQEQ